MNATAAVESKKAEKPQTAGKTEKPAGAPKITALLCENSAYKAHAALRDRLEIACINAVKLPCSGKVDVGLILKILEAGSAGVIVIGCPKDNCTFIRGNYRAEKRIEVVKAALRDAGLEEGLVRMEFVSSLDSHKLLDALRSFKRYIDDHSRS